jgi:hypothetical protein
MVFNDHPEQATLLVSDLHQISEQIIRELYPLTLVNNCFVTNDIPKGISIEADKYIVAASLEKIVTLVAKCARDSQIQLAAKIFGDVILIQVKDHNTYNKRRLEGGLTGLQSLADQLGGFIGLSYPSAKGTTIAFSFPNLMVQN